MANLKEIIRKCSYTFSNGVVVVNTTPHAINFLEVDGTVVEIPSSVPIGEKTGPIVINAVAKSVSSSRKRCVKSAFFADDTGNEIIACIKAEMAEVEPDNLMIVGSMIAMNAYQGEVVGMTPAPGFERVPPQDKRMSCEVFSCAI